jgi:multiple antibiotic resistance protein
MSVQQFFGYFFETLASLLTVVNPPIAIPLFVAQKLGEHGLTALSRVMGFLMVCIGIQFVPSGIAELIKSLH